VPVLSTSAAMSGQGHGRQSGHPARNLRRYPSKYGVIGMERSFLPYRRGRNRSLRQVYYDSNLARTKGRTVSRLSGSICLDGRIRTSECAK
jgi:hypothetical protein